MNTTLSKIEAWFAKQVFNTVNKQSPVHVGDLVRHNMTGFDGNVVGLQFEGWFKPVCRLTVSNNLTGRFISNIDRNEFTHAVKRSLLFPERGY
jgi:hypothetical protein